MYVDRNDAGNIVAAFGVAQRDGQEHLADNAAELLAFLNPPPSPAAAAAAMLSAGLEIVSTGTPALNGTYAMDPAAQANITGVLGLITAGLGFPGGTSTLAYGDVSGAPHSFTQAAWKNFALAAAGFALAVATTAALKSAGQSAEWPSQPVTIA